MNAYQFFLSNAGYSVAEGENKRAGQVRCARALAKAEREGRDAGLSFQWEIDPQIDSSNWSDEEPAYEQWVCTCYNAAGLMVASLGGIDFGRDGSPYGNVYKRVVEAELASEAIPQVQAQPTAKGA